MAEKARQKEKQNKSLKIEIDQSGRVEYTSHDTVIAFSNSEKKAIKLKAKDKRKLQEFFRSVGKGHTYVIKVFSFLIFLLVKDYKFSKIVIDTEYVGRDGVIRGYLLADLAKMGRIVEPGAIGFSRIGKLSEAHWHGYW
ncbi:hypothetical protein HY085_01295 [Candidatus Gottesmanbacteria bacterium]|nr:hypothetical protein [Candidatus Gottesmanbacteria bacterium]